MTKQEVQDKFANLNVWKKEGQRAPHKPLLALYAIGKCLRGEDRFMPFKQVEADLRRFLKEFGPVRKSYHPEYPFQHLRTDGIWELANAEHMRTRATNTDSPAGELRRHDVQGGFSGPVFDLLRSDRRFALDVAKRLLDGHFPESIHDDILQAVGIDMEVATDAKAIRNPAFRNRVLRAYEYRCAVCDFDVRLGNTPIALEAAHIKWHQAGGPDEEVNGIALCTLHHKLFDRGAFTIGEESRIVVSEDAHGSTGLKEWLLEFHGQALRKPQRPSYYPEQEFAKWHLSEVFRGPGRYSG